MIVCQASVDALMLRVLLLSLVVLGVVVVLVVVVEYVVAEVGVSGPRSLLLLTSLLVL